MISTQCRSCRANFTVENGRGVARTKPSSVRLAKSAPITATGPEGEQAEKPSPLWKTTGSSLIAHDSRSFFAKLFQPTRKTRDVVCFKCGHRFVTAREAQSTQCPKCSGYVSMTDYDISDACTRRIETAGDVMIRKTGRVLSSLVRCHDLTVFGELTGSVECSGNFIIRSSSKILGTVHCGHLMIEKSAKVVFLHPVHATKVTIDGEVRGQISCTGPVVLEKRARLTGLVRTTSLVVKSGATHSGMIEMIPSGPSH